MSKQRHIKYVEVVAYELRVTFTEDPGDEAKVVASTMTKDVGGVISASSDGRSMTIKIEEGASDKAIWQHIYERVLGQKAVQGK